MNSHFAISACLNRFFGGGGGGGGGGGEGEGEWEGEGEGEGGDPLYC